MESGDKLCARFLEDRVQVIWSGSDQTGPLSMSMLRPPR